MCLRVFPDRNYCSVKYLGGHGDSSKLRYGLFEGANSAEIVGLRGVVVLLRCCVVVLSCMCVCL